VQGLFFGVQKIHFNTQRMKNSTFYIPISVLFRVCFQKSSSAIWSACQGPCVEKPVRIFSRTTAAVFCTVVTRRLAHCLRTPANGSWLQRLNVILGTDSSSTEEFARPVTRIFILRTVNIKN